MNRNIVFMVLLLLLIPLMLVSSFAAPNNEIKAINKIPSTNPNIDKLILVEGNPATMSANIKDGKLHIKDKLHTHRQVRLNYIELFKNLKGFNGQTLGYTHINDYGIVTNKVINVGEIDNQGFISIEMTFSTVIIDGFTGTTTTTLTGLSGNQSISVSNGSSYDLNITNNQEGTWTINGTDFSKRILWTLNTTSENSTDFQVERVTPYDSDMQVDMNDRQLTYYENNTLIPFWDEDVINSTNATSYVKVPKTSTTEQQQYWLYYGNSSTNNNSNGNNTFIQYHGAATASYIDSLVIPCADGFVYESLVSASSDNVMFGVGNQQSNAGSQQLSAQSVIATNRRCIDFRDSDSSAYEFETPHFSDSTEHRVKIVSDGITAHAYVDDNEISDGSTDVPQINLGLRMLVIGGSTTSKWAFARKYTATEPTWGTDGVEQNATVTLNITASITGNNNTQSYNTSQSREFTLTPTGATNNVFVNTTSTDYDVTITTYWTEDTVKYTEIIANGFANTTIQYTPSFNITSGVLNSTYNLINFANHDYVGNLSTLVDGVNYDSNSTRDGNDVNVSIVNFDTSTHWINFSVPYNPPLDLYSPNDTATLNYMFPPLNHDVLLSWMNTTGIYKYEVYQGAIIKRSGTVYTNSTTVSLPAGEYTWLAYGFDDIFNEYSLDSESFDFTISTNITYENTTGVHGVVYDYLIGIETPLSNTGVYLWNDTYSASAITNSDGYFVFTGLSNSTYYLIAKKDRYYDSSTEVATLTIGNMSEHNIRLIENTGTDYSKHYVEFILKSFFGRLYSDILVNVYIGDSITVFKSDSTGADGSVTFDLTQTQEYRFTFVNSEQDINITKIITPSDKLYKIIVFDTNLIPDEPSSDDILYTVQSININSTHGFINVSFNDTSSTTTLAELWIKDKNNQSTLYHFDTTDNTKEWSQVVDGGNASYLVVFKIDNTILTDTLTITRTIYFDNDININLGLENNWSYILIAVIIISIPALLATKLNSEIMAVVTVLTGWLMVFFGWLTTGMTIEEKITVGLMLLLATLVAFATMVKKGEK